MIALRLLVLGSITLFISPAYGRDDIRPASVGARGFLAPTLGGRGFGGGIDLSYSVAAPFALGVQAQTFRVDHASEGDACMRCIESGTSLQLELEGRLFPRLVFTPYARLGGGAAHLQGQSVRYVDSSETVPVISGEIGFELHPAFLSLRVFAFDWQLPTTEYSRDAFRGFGVQIGARS